MDKLEYQSNPPKYRTPDGGWTTKNPYKEKPAKSKALEMIKELKKKDREMTPNSREQYNQNRESGDSSALELTYEEWKKL